MTAAAPAGVPVYSINSGSGSEGADFASGFLGNVNDEVAKACAFLRAHKDLHRGFNFVGFSQGGQFARAVVQRCGCARLLSMALETVQASQRQLSRAVSPALCLPDC